MGRLRVAAAGFACVLGCALPLSALAIWGDLGLVYYVPNNGDGTGGITDLETVVVKGTRYDAPFLHMGEFDGGNPIIFQDNAGDQG